MDLGLKIIQSVFTALIVIVVFGQVIYYNIFRLITQDLKMFEVLHFS